MTWAALIDCDGNLSLVSCISFCMQLLATQATAGVLARACLTCQMCWSKCLHGSLMLLLLLHTAPMCNLLVARQLVLAALVYLGRRTLPAIFTEAEVDLNAAAGAMHAVAITCIGVRHSSASPPPSLAVTHALSPASAPCWQCACTG